MVYTFPIVEYSIIVIIQRGEPDIEQTKPH